MRRHRCYCAILICLLAAISLLFSLTFQLAAASPIITAEIKTSADGKTITVTFSIENNPGIAAFRFTIHYDNNIFKPASAAMNSKISGFFGSNLDSATTAFNMVWVNGTNYNADGELCTATFSVIGTVKDGKYPVTITYDPADIVKIIGDNPESVTISAKGMTASTQTVSVQSVQSNPAASTNTGSKTQSMPVPSSSATSSMTVFSSASNRTSTPVIEVNSQVVIPDYTGSQTSGAITQQSFQSFSGAVQNTSDESNQTKISGTKTETDYPTQSQPSGEDIAVQSPDHQTPIILVIAVSVIAAAAVIVFTVLLMNKKKT